MCLMQHSLATTTSSEWVGLSAGGWRNSPIAGKKVGWGGCIGGGMGKKGRGRNEAENRVGRRAEKVQEGGGISSSTTAYILSSFPVLIRILGSTWNCTSYKTDLGSSTSIDMVKPSLGQGNNCSFISRRPLWVQNFSVGHNAHPFGVLSFGVLGIRQDWAVCVTSHKLQPTW